MSGYKIQVVLLDEALTFVRSLPLKVQQKITYNYKKIEHGIVDKELFKKLENSEIWYFIQWKLLSPILFLGHGDWNFDCCHTWYSQEDPKDSPKRNCKGRRD